MPRSSGGSCLQYACGCAALHMVCTCLQHFSQPLSTLPVSARRKCTAQLFSAALDSSQAVQQAIATEAAKGTKALDRLVSQHCCVEHEEALRSEIFSQILASS